MPDVAIAASNEAAADAGEQVARAGGNGRRRGPGRGPGHDGQRGRHRLPELGGFVTVQPADGGPPYTVDGWMDMPGRDRDLGGGTWDVSTEYGGGITMTVGPGSVAAHGSLAAFGEAHRRDGRLSWPELVAPALDVARGGFRLGSASRYYLEHVHEEVFGWDAASRSAVHGPGGEVTTEPIVLPDLVRSLRLIADDGPSALHVGELATMITDDVIDRGGILGPADLASYRPVVRPSLVTRIGGWTLATTRRPRSVGW